MNILSTRAALGAAISGLLALSGCVSSGSGTGVPRASLGSQATSAHVQRHASVPLSGQWAGTFIDIAYGTGTAKASYSAYQSGVGGVLAVNYKSHKVKVKASVALVANGSAVDGTTVVPAAGSYCTLSTTSTYDPKTKIMSGSYNAVYGCTGDSGTFTLKHQCYYKGSGSEDVRPEFGPKPC